MSGHGSSSELGSPMAAPGFASYQPTTIRLTRSPQGMRAFRMKIPVILGPNLTETLKNAETQFFVSKSWEPSTAKLYSLYEHIFNRIVPALENHDDLLVRMGEACGSNGPFALHWLQEELNPGGSASSIAKLITLFTTDIDYDEPATSLQNLLSENNTLLGDFHLNPIIIAALMLAKLPPSLESVRDLGIQQPNLPSPQAIISQVKTSVQFKKAAVAAASSKNVFAIASSKPLHPPSRNALCFNCDTTDHPPGKCDKPTVPCDVCGIFAGHLEKYCLVKNNHPLPKGWDSDRKAVMESKRAAYKNMNNKPSPNAAVLCVPVQEEFSDNFWESITKSALA